MERVKHMNLIPNYEEVVNLLEGLYDFVIDEGVLDVLESAPYIGKRIAEEFTKYKARLEE